MKKLSDMFVTWKVSHPKFYNSIDIYTGWFNTAFHKFLDKLYDHKK
jgi:hypothetical protein